MRKEFLEHVYYLNYCLYCYEEEANKISPSLEIFNEFSYWSLNIVNMEPEEFYKIYDDTIKIIEEYNINYINYIKNAKIYFEGIYNKLKYVHDDRRGWRYRYPELDDTGLIYDIEMEMMCTLQNLLGLMKTPPFKLFEIMTSEEKISLRNMCREKNLYYDIERYISGFIGFNNYNDCE